MKEKERPCESTFSQFSSFSRKVTGDDVVFLRVPVFILDGYRRKILSDPLEKSWQDKNITSIT